MKSHTAIEHTLNYIFVNATREDLERKAGWYYRCIGKPDKEQSVNRSTLEKILFIYFVLDLAPDGIYQMSLDFEIYPKQAFMSGAEVIRYIIEKCTFDLSRDFDGFKNIKTGQRVTVRYVAMDKEFKMR